MKNHINIPRDFKQSEQLTCLVNRILNILTIDSLYLSSHQNYGETSYYIVTAFVVANIEPIPHEVLDLISKIEQHYSDFRVRIYTEASAETALERGSLYFVAHCCLGSKLFSHPEGQNILEYENLALQTLLKRAERYFKSELKKVNGFIKSADLLIKDNQYGLAVFNLHQAFELTFRCIESTCLGKSKITHSIIGHINYCKSVFPQIKLFSEVTKTENSELLILLDHAYSEARYSEDCHISKAQYLSLHSELNSFIKEIEALFHTHLNYCKQYIDDIDNEPWDPLKIEPSKESSEIDCIPEPIPTDPIRAKIDKLVNKKFYKTSPDANVSYYKTKFLTTGLTDVLYDIAGIMKVCIVTLQYTDGYRNSLIPQPHINVQTALEHILQLLPFEELECLEDIIKENELLLKEKI